ncbi:MAG: ABC transporter ATP-binding protein [Burkholderiales bacterium]|nr:ABC transporter ATP-binding protein [Burkholderiales bacterium]
MNLAEQAQRSVAPSPAVLTARGAAKTYPGGVRALEPVDLEVREGEFVTLIGPSGCGKSTLLRILAGLAAPSGGEIRWWGGGADRLGEPGRHLSFVFQDPTLMPWASVAANVRLPLDLARRARGESDPRVAAALGLVGLGGFESSYPRQLSGGMQMRVSIARALVTDPDLLLMDEPFGALDEITRARLDADLLALWSRRRLTVVFVTHSIYEAVFLSTRVLVLSARPGRIVGEVAIDAPFPRGDAFRVSTGFAGFCQRLSDLLAQASATGAVGA